MPDLDYSPALNEDGTEFDIVKAAEIAVEAIAKQRASFRHHHIRYCKCGEELVPLASSPAPTGLDRNAVLDEVMDLIDNIPLVGDERRYRSELLNRLVSLRAATRPAEDAGT